MKIVFRSQIAGIYFLEFEVTAFPYFHFQVHSPTAPVTESKGTPTSFISPSTRQKVLNRLKHLWNMLKSFVL